MFISSITSLIFLCKYVLYFIVILVRLLLDGIAKEIMVMRLQVGRKDKLVQMHDCIPRNQMNDINVDDDEDLMWSCTRTGVPSWTDLYLFEDLDNHRIEDLLACLLIIDLLENLKIDVRNVYWQIDS